MPLRSEKPSRFNLMAILAVCAVGVVAYANTFAVPFVFDDYANVRDNPNLHIQQIRWQDLWSAANSGPSAQRPVANLTFALNYYFGGDSLWGFHALNLAIHLACGVLVYFLGIEILQRAGASPPPVYSALAAALIFVAHPLQTQAVTYIVQRMTCLAAMFYLGALLCYVRGRSRAGRSRYGYWAGTIAAGLLALGSKEIAATLPVAILLVEWYFFQDLDRRWLRRTCLVAAPILAIGAAVTLTSPSLRQALFGGYAMRDFTLAERLLTQPRVVMYYLGLVICPFPSRLSITHDFATSHGLLDPATTILSILALAGLVAIAAKAARRYRIVSFCILWVLLHLVIESTVIPLEMIYEHRMYLPMAGIAWLAGWALFAAIALRPASALVAGIVLLLTCATFVRNEVWRSEETLWADVLAKYPTYARAYNNLGSALASQGRHDEAIHYHRRALELKPTFAEAHNNLGIALASQGDFAGAAQEYRAALAADSHYALAHNNLGNALTAQSNIAGAVEQYRQALDNRPNYADAHYNLAAALAAQGDLAEATEHYRLALRYNPHYFQAANNLGALLASDGKLAEAVEQFRYALNLQPDYIDALSNLGSVLGWQKQLPEARQYLQKALELAEAQGNQQVAAAIRERLSELAE